MRYSGEGWEERYVNPILAELVIRLQARILVHYQWISAQTDNKLGTDIEDNPPCHSNEGGLETLPAVRSARVTASN
jgi:hypothetical protein